MVPQPGVGGEDIKYISPMALDCENIRFSSLFAAGRRCFRRLQWHLSYKKSGYISVKGI